MLRNISKKFYQNVYGESVYDEPMISFYGIVKDNLTDGLEPKKILDAACGYNNQYLAKLLSEGDIEANNLTGIDIDEDVVGSNKIHHDIHIQDLHSPLGNDEYDAVISLYTWEHLEDAAKVMVNFKQALKKNGKVIIIAPHKYYYISIIERLLPKKLKDLSWRVFKGRNVMPYPAFFQLCTRSSLEKEANKVGFELKHYKAIDTAPIWFSKFPPLFMLMCLSMSVFNRFEIFENLRGAFVAVLVKREA